MHFIEAIKKLLRHRAVQVGLLAVVFTLVLSALTTDNETIVETVEADRQLVSVTTPAEYAGKQTLSLIGTARAYSEAAITAEKAGRVVSITVALGDRVQAGQVLGSVENASERAAVLQAEGVYEAALAAAAQTNFGVAEAETRLANAQQTAITAARAAYTTTNSTVVSNIDTFFSNPNSSIPGLRVGGRGYTMDLNAERVAYQDLLPEWQAQVDSLTADSDLFAALTDARENVERTIDMLDIFLFIFDQRKDDDYVDDEVTFSNLRASLIGTLTSIDAAKTGLLSAQDSLDRATASATGGTASAADAQVKQALGALRSAQANLEKTYFRSPISGTVNALTVRTGDFVSSFTPVATVANNTALEVVTFISGRDRAQLNVGDAVVIEGQYSGTVTNIAPAVDSATGKIEVRIAAEGSGIDNGETVRVTKVLSDSESVLGQILVPLSAVRFAATDGFVFLIEADTLVSRPVTLGTVRGGSVEILSGLEATDTFVTDARGLQAGSAVTVRQN